MFWGSFKRYRIINIIILYLFPYGNSFLDLLRYKDSYLKLRLLLF